MSEANTKAVRRPRLRCWSHRSNCEPGAMTITPHQDSIRHMFNVRYVKHGSYGNTYGTGTMEVEAGNRDGAVIACVRGVRDFDDWKGALHIEIIAEYWKVDGL